jgi:methylthioribose-1-phosphate isomerase
MRMITWQNGTVYTPDQTLLPLQEVTLEIRTVEQMCEAIKVLRIRAPRCWVLRERLG